MTDAAPDLEFAHPANPLDAPGLYRRRIVLQAEGPRVFAALEDDFHHLYVEILHDGDKVTAVSGKTLRIPRTTCPGAVDRLQAAKGMTLAAGARGIDPRQQCTHLFDIARLAMAQALRSRSGQNPRRQYDISVPDPVDDLSRPEIRRDGQPVMEWEVRGRTIVAPEAFAADDLFGKIRWSDPEKSMDPDTLEAAMALRRAIWISYGRGAQAAIRQMAAEGKNLNGQWMPAALKGACYSFQPEIHATGRQNADSSQDFTHRPAALLAELAAGAGGTPRW